MMNQEMQNYEIQVNTNVETVTVGSGARLFETLLWVPLVIPGLIFQACKVSAENYFHALEQKINNQASEIDNYLTQRVVVLQNCARLLDRAVDLDKTVYTTIAELKFRPGMTDAERNQLSAALDNQWNNVSMLVEKYPDLRAHEALQEAMHQNLMLQKEITAARTMFNDAVLAWNRAIFEYPAKRIVAAKHGYTTRIPFVASREIRQQAEQVFF